MRGYLEADSVFLGLTRPPMIFGVSYMFALMNFMASIGYFILTSNFLGVIIFLPAMHLIGCWLSSKEPKFMELLKTRQDKCRRCRNRMYYGNVNSYKI